MCDSKWPIRQVPKIVKEAEKRTKNTPTQPEREHPAIEVSPILPCGAISLGRRPSYIRAICRYLLMFDPYFCYFRRYLSN